MSTTGESWDGAVFDRLYAGSADPWRFATDPYERAKYAATLALLPTGSRWRAALELGCSIGVFTAALAPRCDTLLAVDCAAAALARARTACDGHAQVRFERHLVPGSFPSGRFDLVVISELLYFLSPPDLVVLAGLVDAATTPEALVLLANWTGHTDTPTTGDAAATIFADALRPRFSPRATARAETYRLDLLRSAATPGASP